MKVREAVVAHALFGLLHIHIILTPIFAFYNPLATTVGGNSSQSATKYKGTIDCIIKIWRNEGTLGYFKGVVPNALKVAPSAAITFVVYEETLKHFARRRQ